MSKKPNENLTWFAHPVTLVLVIPLVLLAGAWDGGIKAALSSIGTAWRMLQTDRPMTWKEKAALKALRADAWEKQRAAKVARLAANYRA